ncbi:heterokaryon incompatibility protein Het-C-domain-containing protein [Crucibulum laeve]|uniref:Heterokaryon incompatibility protein Het-C-domain-containing protein n=1 Tax=Crucibulum laeve TaxID=68775 RepID=A0A5C3MAY4_9AGAR|nr:heterokaryon incompatibility protein Het-C-domain-containing protein [Crucibulum laeve]
MGFTPNLTTTFLLLTVLIVLLPTETYAFGAGDIPDFAYLNDKAFRHGDIENILEKLVKNVGGAAIGGGGLLGFAKSVIKQASGGSKFSRSDIKKVYFGNWLRDYSQAMDIAGLSKLSADTLVLVVSVLGFMTFGFATEEFEVTADRLGVYLPVEHIDNPKGYAEKEGDAREYHPKLRPPVDPRELEIDERTGMKNYMATEGQGWDTSTAFIRRTIRACIEAGRRARGQEGAELWEAYRLLGTGLHTMEDLLAHSNWCEVALRKMGHEEVFCHVGDDVTVETPNGRAPPLVTGTFGGADFLHSLIGEAGDKLSQASVTDLSEKMNQAAQGDNENSNVASLKSILSKLPIGGGEEKMNKGEEIHEQAKGYNFDPDNIAPPEVQQQLLDLLKWRDSVMRDILSKIEMVPGLSDLIEELTNALNAYVYTVLAPYLAPILTQATGVLDEGSKAVINNEDQYAVFDNPNASDPSHSLLSKDHFGLILNEPAGKIAQIVVEHSVTLIVEAWANEDEPDRVIDKILEAFHHPYYATGHSQIQHQMFEHMQMWIGGLGPDEASQVIQALTKESVRDHKNKRIGSEDQSWDEPGYGGCSHGGSRTETPKTSSYGQGNSYSSGNTYGSSQTYGETRHESSYGGRTTNEEVQSSRRNDNDGYGSSGRTHGQSSEQGSYGSNSNNDETEGYESGRRDKYGSGRGGEYSYGGERAEEQSYGRQEQSTNSGYTPSYGQNEQRGTYGANTEYSRGGEEYGSSTYGRNDGRGDSEGHGSRRHHHEGPSREENQGYTPSYGQSEERSYGGGNSYATGDSNNRSSGYGGERESSGYGGERESSGYGGGSYGRQESSAYGQEETTGYGHSSSSGYGGGSYGRQESSAYGQEETTGYGHNSTSGYASNYGGGDETFGAERLNINNDNEEHEEHRHGRRHHHEEY